MSDFPFPGWVELADPYAAQRQDLHDRIYARRQEVFDLFAARFAAADAAGDQQAYADTYREFQIALSLAMATFVEMLNRLPAVPFAIKREQLGVQLGVQPQTLD